MNSSIECIQCAKILKLGDVKKHNSSKNVNKRLAKIWQDMDNISCVLDHWCSGLTCLPVTEKTTSSNLVWSAKNVWPGSSAGRALD